MTEEGKITMVDRCVCCGEPVPEGRQVCPQCERKEKRLIDANTLKQKFDAREADDIEMYGVHIIECFPADDAKEIVDEMPTVDAVEVVHGRWEWLGPYRYNDDGMIGTCSVCKERLRIFAHNYCPNCGAKMDGKRRDNHE